MNTLIITGGQISKTFLKNYLNENKYDIIIVADKGLESIDALNIEPNYIIGDFDSVNQNILEKYKNRNINRLLNLMR